MVVCTSWKRKDFIVYELPDSNGYTSMEPKSYRNVIHFENNAVPFPHANSVPSDQKGERCSILSRL